MVDFLPSMYVCRYRCFDINDVRFWKIWTAFDGKYINLWNDLNVFDLFDRMKGNIKIMFLLIEHTKAHSKCIEHILSGCNKICEKCYRNQNGNRQYNAFLQHSKIQLTLKLQSGYQESKFEFEANISFHGLSHPLKLTQFKILFEFEFEQMNYVGQDEIVKSIWDNAQHTSLWCW